MTPRTTLLTLVLLVGCGPSDPGKPDDSDTTSGTTSTGTVPGSVLAKTPPTFTQFDPVDNPLGYWLDLETTEEATVTVTVDGELLPVSSTGTVHRLRVLGFRPDRVVPVDVTIQGATATETIPVDITTAPLPDDFPEIEVILKDEARMAPGYTLVLIRPGALTGPESDPDYLVALDADGEVVWWLHSPETTLFDASIAPNGNLFIMADYEGEATGGPIIDMTLDGEELARYDSNDSSITSGVQLSTLGMHHEAFRRLDGRTVGLTKEGVFVEDYPASYVDPALTAPTVVSADVLVEWDETGGITNEWRVADWFPLNRIGYESLDKSHFDDLIDWTHGNGADIHDADETAIISLRNQDAIVKVDRDNNPIWILGTHENYPPEVQDLLLTPDESVEWFYKQHAPMLSSDGQRVLVFDNGESRASPYDGVVLDPVDERYSRAVEYTIDEATMTVTQTWELKETSTGVLYSPVIGDADYLSNGNVLATFGFVNYIDGVNVTDMGLGAVAVRLIEAEPHAPDEIVWDLRIYSQASDRVSGWFAYRADRIDSLYGDDGY